MTLRSASSRRSFLKGGALIAMPLAAAAPVTANADDGLRSRLARLEDEAAIRALHQAWLRHINAGTDSDARSGQTMRSVTPDHAADAEVIEFAPDGRSARGWFPCLVTFETALAKDCTFTQMAHAQGNGFVRRTERCVMRASFVKREGSWTIHEIAFAPA